jgi:hypothetical protein
LPRIRRHGGRGQVTAVRAALIEKRRPPIARAAHDAWRSARAAVRCFVFVVKMIPRPTSPIDWITPEPIVEKLTFDTPTGPAEADLYHPPGLGAHPGVVAAFGIVPPDAVDARVPQMGAALARAGFSALLYWSPGMRDLQIEPSDVAELVTAYEVLLRQPSVDPARSGMTGVCIGASIALLAAADPAIRDRVRFVCAYAPYASLRSFAVDVASGARHLPEGVEPWDVDPLTWKVYVQAVTGWLPAADARQLRSAFEPRITWDPTRTVVLHAPVGVVEPAELSADGRTALRLLAADGGDIEAALAALPPAAQELLTAMSQLAHLDAIRARRIILMHDRFDHVVPVGESRQLRAALAGRPGVVYTELFMRHLKMPNEFTPLRIVRELIRFLRAWYPLFRETEA